MSDLSSALKAYASVIRSQQEAGKEHEPTPTEYFAVTVKTLGKATEQSSEFLVSTLRIMEAVIPQAAAPIVRAQFTALSANLLEIIVQSADDAQLLRVSLVALGSLLCAQDMSDGFWASVQPLQCLNTMLLMLEDSNTKLRKVAEDQIIRLLQQHKVNKASKAVRTYVADFCMGVIKTCSRSNYKQSLYIVLFMESGLSLLADHGDRPKKYFDSLLGLQECGVAVLTAAAIRCLDAYFQSPHLATSNSQIALCLQTLIERKLLSEDMESNTYRYLALGSGFVALCRRDISLGFALLKKLCRALVDGCEGDWVQIHDAVGTCLKRIAGECVTPKMVIDAAEQATAAAERTGGSSSNSFVGVLVHTLEELLETKYRIAWLHALGACKKLMEVITMLRPSNNSGPSCSDLLAPLIKQLAGIYALVESRSVEVDASTHLTMGETLGVAFRSVGFADFLEIVPVRTPSLTPEYLAIDEGKEWMLQLFHTNLKLMKCSLCDFAVVVLPMVAVCKEALADPQSYQLQAWKVPLVKARVSQLLSLFPDFCHAGPADLCAFLPRIMPELVEILQARGNKIGLGDSSADSAKAERDSEWEALNNSQHILTGLAQIANLVHEASGGTVYKSTNNSAEGESLVDVEEGGRGMKVLAQGPMDFTRKQTPDFAVTTKQANTVLPAVLALLERMSLGDPSFASAVRCVSAWASVASPDLVKALSKKLMELLLAGTGAAGAKALSNAERQHSSWMAITLAVVPYLPVTYVHILYKTIRPLLAVDQTVSAQKRAYSILEAALHLHGRRLFEVEPREAILQVVSDSLMNAHVSARNMRLRCIETILSSMCDSVTQAETPETHAQAYARLMAAADCTFGEVLICQKDSNQKTRDASNALLTLFVSHLAVEDSLMRLCSAVVAETASMRSAAVLGLSMLCLKHRDDTRVTDTLPQLLETLCMLLGEETAELSRAVLTFLKVCAAVLPMHMIQPLMPRMLSACTQELGSLKPKFAVRCRGIVRKLLTRAGEGAVRPHVPAEDLPLLEYLLRADRRKERKADENGKGKSKGLLDSDDEADDDDDEEGGVGADDDDVGDHAGNLMDVVQATSARRYAHVFGQDRRIAARPKAVRSGGAADERLPASLTDLLEDQGKDASSGTSSGSGSAAAAGRKGKKRGRGDEQQETAADGTAADQSERYHVVMEDGVLVVREKDDSEVAVAAGGSARRGVGNSVATAGAGEEEDEEELAAKKRKKEEAAAEKRKKAAQQLGSEYKSKKSGGDVWRKGQLEPHAYIPLDAKLMAGRNAREAMGKFAGVVGGTNILNKRAHMAAAVANAKSHVVVGNRKQREARNKNKRRKGGA